jgi:cytochrome c peroxidase
MVLKSAPDTESPEKNFEIAFKRLMLAVGAYEHSSDMNSFSSKRDNALRAELACTDNEFSDYYDPKVCKHENYLNSPGKFPLVGLTDQENLGHDLFYNNPVRFTLEDGTRETYVPFPDLPQAKCSECHSDTPRAATPEGINDGSELLQTYSRNDFHNLSIPPNPEIPGNPIVTGVSARGIDTRDGFFRTPTVRNVDKRKDKDFIKAYMHNGWFKSLESVVHFYNTAFLGDSRTPYEETTAAEFGIKRCEEVMKPNEIEDGVTEKEALANNCWPAPEFVGGSPIPFLLGDLHLSLEEEAALVAYLKTLSDEYTPQAPKPYNNKK